MRRWLLLLALAALLACGPFPPKGGDAPESPTVPAARPTPAARACEEAAPTEPTPADLERLLSYVPARFRSWEHQETLGEMRATTTWSDGAGGSVLYLEYLLFPCPIQPADVDSFLSDENFDEIILHSYAEKERVADCRRGDLRLYEYEVSFAAAPYAVRYWA